MTVSDVYQISAFYEFESASQFPNLLKDRDFAYYYWTLPFCNL